MKLDKIKFAMLVHYITNRLDVHMDAVIIESLDELIDIDDPQPHKASCADVDELLKQIINPDGFISAIKAYRVLTGAGLKESKDAVERYRIVTHTSTPAIERKFDTLGDILDEAKRNLNY